MRKKSSFLLFASAALLGIACGGKAVESLSNSRGSDDRSPTNDTDRKTPDSPPAPSTPSVPRPDDPTSDDPVCTGPPDEEWIQRQGREELAHLLDETFHETKDVQVGSYLLQCPDPADSSEWRADAALLTDLKKAAELYAAVMAQEGMISYYLDCEAEEITSECLSPFVQERGSALYRRPLTDQERSTYLDLFENIAQQSTPLTGLKWMIVALIQSPHSLYHLETEN